MGMKTEKDVRMTALDLNSYCSHDLQESKGNLAYSLEDATNDSFCSTQVHFRTSEVETKVTQLNSFLEGFTETCFNHLGVAAKQLKKL